MLLRYMLFVLFVIGVVPAARAGQTAYPPLEREPACQTLTPTAAGGSRPINPDTLDVLYRTSVCFSTTTKDMVIGW